MIPEDKSPQGTNNPYDWFGNQNVTPLPPPPAAPPASNEGKPPVWDIPPELKQQNTPASGSLGLAFAIALIVLGAIAIILIAVLLSSQKDVNAALHNTAPLSTPTVTTNPQQPTATPPPPLAANDAIALVTNFYGDVGAANYQDAYNLLSTGLRSQKNLDQFSKSWQGTLQLTVDTSSITATSNDNATITVSLQYTQVKQQSGNGSPQTRTFTASLDVGYEKGSPKILKISTTETTPSPTPEPATDTPVPATDTPTPTTATPHPSVTPTPTPTGTPTK